MDRPDAGNSGGGNVIFFRELRQAAQNFISSAEDDRIGCFLRALIQNLELHQGCVSLGGHGTAAATLVRSVAARLASSDAARKTHAKTAPPAIIQDSWQFHLDPSSFRNCIPSIGRYSAPSSLPEPRSRESARRRSPSFYLSDCVVFSYGVEGSNGAGEPGIGAKRSSLRITKLVVLNEEDSKPWPCVMASVGQASTQ